MGQRLMNQRSNRRRLLGNTSVAAYLGPIGLLGIGMTLGLFFYELRGLKLCTKFIEAGKDLESGLGLQIGQFKNNPEERFSDIIGAGQQDALFICQCYFQNE
jgi:hypothetical protein